MRGTKWAWLATATAFAVGLTTVAPPAEAIPAFARKYNLSCSSCHLAQPYLNSTGRAFKEAGYRMPDEDGEIDPDSEPTNRIGNWLVFEKPFPISGRVVSRPYDDKKGSDAKLNVLHEVELLMSGNFWKSGSFYIEAEGEDEESFEVAVSGALGWHPRRSANLQGGYGSLFFSDPYNSLKDGGHRLTVSHKLPLDVGKSTASRFRKPAQNLNFYGRQKKLFYMVGYSSGNSNPEGENPNDFLGRLAYDFTPHLMIGAIYYDGKREDIGVDLRRTGFDFNFDFGDFHAVGLWFKGEEETFGGLPENNDSGYAELFYTHQKDNRPFFVPLIRYDFAESNDGRDQLSALSAQLAFYLVENARVGVEYYSEIDSLPGRPEIDRFTVFADIAF